MPSQSLWIGENRRSLAYCVLELFKKQRSTFYFEMDNTYAETMNPGCIAILENKTSHFGNSYGNDQSALDCYYKNAIRKLSKRHVQALLKDIRWPTDAGKSSSYALQ